MSHSQKAKELVNEPHSSVARCELSTAGEVILRLLDVLEIDHRLHLVRHENWMHERSLC
jgi:hypothetical protein